MSRSRALIFGGLAALGPFTIDLYLPAFPAVARDFAASEGAVQLTLSATTLGFGLGQALIGPLSDSLGRRGLLGLTTLLHVLASLAILWAPSLGWVTLARVVQGLGASGSAVLATAMLRDLFAGQALIAMMARMALITSMAPILAPVIGSQLLGVLPWRGLFLVLAGYGAVMALIARRLPETLPPERRLPLAPRALVTRYAGLVGDPVYLGVLAIGAMSFSTMFLYLSWSSFLYQEDFGLTAQGYGLAFGANALGLMAASQTSSRLMRRHPPARVMGLWLGLMLTGAAGLWISDRMGAAVPVQMGLIFVTVMGIGGTNPTVQVTALSRHGARAGTAAALLGVSNFAVAGLVAPLVGLGGVSVATVSGGMILAILVAHLSLHLIVRPRAGGVIT